MAWNDTPLGADRRNATQPTIRQNFQTVQDNFSVDHYPLGSGDATYDGKHKAIHLHEQGAAPTTLANEAALYAALGAISGKSELVFRRDTDGAIIPFTECGNSWAYLPSGILVKWGMNSFTGNQEVTVNWGPNFTTSIFNWALVTTTTAFARSIGRFVSCLPTGVYPTTAKLRIEGKHEGTGADYNTQCTFIIMGI